MNNCINNNEFGRRNASFRRGAGERIIELVCMLLCVFDIPEVRVTLRVLSGAAALTGFYFLIGAVIGGRVGVAAALLSGTGVVLAALFALKE